MTCEDCIHNDVCCSYLIADEDFEITNADKMANSCNDFADRSLFIELPCKVGDSYFEIEQYCTERGYYTEPQRTDTVDCEYCDVDGVCDRQYRITEKRFVSLIQIFEYKEKAADKYNRKFLTKEEAEKAIKEREIND